MFCGESSEDSVAVIRHRLGMYFLVVVPARGVPGAHQLPLAIQVAAIDETPTVESVGTRGEAGDYFLRVEQLRE